MSKPSYTERCEQVAFYLERAENGGYGAPFENTASELSLMHYYAQSSLAKLEFSISTDHYGNASPEDRVRFTQNDLYSLAACIVSLAESLVES